MIAQDVERAAREWCEKHPGWMSACDIDGVDKLFKNWDELTERERSSWRVIYGDDKAPAAWREYNRPPCRVPYGYINAAGEFFHNYWNVPADQGAMMVFKVSKS
jgi:hypothetical protein